MEREAEQTYVSLIRSSADLLPTFLATTTTSRFYTVPGHDNPNNTTQLDNTTTRHAPKYSAHIPVQSLPTSCVRVSFTITALTLPCAIIYTTRIADSCLTPAGAGLALAVLQPASWALHAAQVNRAHTNSRPIAGASPFIQHDRNPSRNTGEFNVADHCKVVNLAAFAQTTSASHQII